MNKTVLVTGSSRGLGAVIVRTLSQQGYNVIINYFQNKVFFFSLHNENMHSEFSKFLCFLGIYRHACGFLYRIGQ